MVPEGEKEASLIRVVMPSTCTIICLGVGDCLHGPRWPVFNHLAPCVCARARVRMSALVSKVFVHMHWCVCESACLTQCVCLWRRICQIKREVRASDRDTYWDRTTTFSSGLVLFDLAPSKFYSLDTKTVWINALQGYNDQTVCHHSLSFSSSIPPQQPRLFLGPQSTWVCSLPTVGGKALAQIQPGPASTHQQHITHRDMGREDREYRRSHASHPKQFVHIQY